MAKKRMSRQCLLVVLICAAGLAARAQSFQVQCPTSTITHPDAVNDMEPAYTGATGLTSGTGGYLHPTSNVNGAIKCQQISGGDGFATMGDGTQTYLFAFGPLSGLADIAKGRPGTQPPSIFNGLFSGSLNPGDPATTDGATSNSPGTLGLFNYNGAIGQVIDSDALAGGQCGGVGQHSCIDGHVDPRQIMDVGVMNGNIPAPLMAIDEDDEFFLTLTNVGMIMRPDLFEQHTVHFHGYPNASSFYDGVPDASVAINIGGSFTYYYLAPDAGTYFWHCHITPPEHLQMGMVGQIYRAAAAESGAGRQRAFTTALQQQNDPRTAATDLRTACNPAAHPLRQQSAFRVDTCRAQAGDRSTAMTSSYAYNDGDGSTYYDVEYPIQIHGFDPNFHFVGMTFNPEGFADMKDKYFLLNGRSYPDTVTTGPLETQSSRRRDALLAAAFRDHQYPGGRNEPFCAFPTWMFGVPDAGLARNSDAGHRLQRQTAARPGGQQHVLQDQLDHAGRRRIAGRDPGRQRHAKYPRGSTFYLYTPNLDHLSNDAENFGGLMTEVHICKS